MVCKVSVIWSVKCVCYGLRSVCAMVCKVSVIWSVKCVVLPALPIAMMFIVRVMLCVIVYFQWLVQ